MTSKWIVMLNYNVAEHCLRNLDALRTLPDVGIFFVDNCSSPADYALLRAGCESNGGWLLDSNAALNIDSIAVRLAAGPHLILLRNETNLGYSGGNNAALRMLDAVLHGRGQYLIVNPDVFISALTASALLDNEAELCGPAIYEHWRQGLATDDLAKDFATGFSTRAAPNRRRVNILHGSCFKVSGSALAKYGFLPDDNFLYEEEVRYFERVHRLGGTPVYLDQLQVEHIGKASTRKLSYIYFYYIFRNRLSYFIEIGGPHYRRYGRFWFLYCSWAQDVIRSQARKRNWAGIRGLVRGVWDGLRGIKGPLPRSSRD